jgi:hypothetical protein
LDLIYPSDIALKQVAQTLLPTFMEGRRIFDFLDLVEVDDHVLAWEQKDNFVGLQQVRGLDGDPSRVKNVGGKRYIMEPGVYGEFMVINERDITARRQFGTLNDAINIDDLVREKQDQLLVRRLDRIEQIGWTLVSTGTFSVADGNSVLHTDAYTTQTYSAGTAWGTVATATPLADLRAIQLKSRGYSVDFGSRAVVYMNRTTFNQMIANTNAADLGGRRVTGFQTVNGPNQLNELLSQDDLPNIAIYDRGYLNDSGTFTLFIPNNKAIVIGARTDGAPVGEYRLTRNANNPGASAGPYMKTVDDPDRVPRTIEVHDGHNGGPILYHPSAIVVATV